MNGRFALLTIGLAMMAGCHPPGDSGTVAGAQGASVGSDYNVVNVPVRDQQLVYERTKIPVEAVASKKGKDFRIELLGHNEVFEYEAYRSEPNQFSLVDAAGESFTPPIPILKFPMNIGDSWTWTGEMMSSARTRNVTAKITTSPDRFVTKSRTYAELVKVEVLIQMDSGAATPATRILTFWIDKSDGVIRRKFGVGGSLREPRDPEEQ